MSGGITLQWLRMLHYSCSHYATVMLCVSYMKMHSCYINKLLTNCFDFLWIMNQQAITAVMVLNNHR